MERTLWRSDTWFLDLTVSEHNGGTASTSFEVFLLTWIILKVFLLQYSFCFIFRFLATRHGILVPQPRVQATLPAWKATPDR